MKNNKEFQFEKVFDNKKYRYDQSFVIRLSAINYQERLKSHGYLVRIVRANVKTMSSRPIKNYKTIYHIYIRRK